MTLPRTYDLHCHYFPPDMPRWSQKFRSQYDYFWLDIPQSTGCGTCAWMMKGAERFRSLSDSRLWEPEAYAELQGELGIDVLTLSPTPQNFYYDAPAERTAEIARFQNESIAALQQKFPERFLGLGTVPLQDPDLACIEIEYCMKALGLCGVEIATSCAGFDLADEKFFSFFKRASDLGAAIFVHPWYMPTPERLQPPGRDRQGWGNWLLAMPSETAIAMFQLCISGLLDRLPNLRIGFAHGGGSFPWLLSRMTHGLQVRPEYFPEQTSFERFARSVYYDSHLCGEHELQHLVRVAGAERVFAGSDWPYPLGDSNVLNFIRGSLNAQDAMQVLSHTPEDFLGLSTKT